ncbi:MAG: FxDxF family PEP-CTERM protein [Betaproteobacteria bacterium]
MFKVRSVVRMLGAVALGGACVAASAATTNLGSLPVGATAFSGMVPVGPFIDTFTFTVPANGGTGYSVVNFPVSGGFGSFNTLFSSLALFSNPDGILFNGDDLLLTSVNSPPGPGPVSSLSLNWSATSGGGMYLTVGGVGNGSLGGLYSGAISVTPVPEPATWAMMATGAILLGFGLRRTRP